MTQRTPAEIDALIDETIRDYAKPGSQKGGGLWNFIVGSFLSTPLARIVCPERKRVYDRVWERRASLKAAGQI